MEKPKQPLDLAGDDTRQIMETGVLYRSFAFNRDSIDEGKRTVELSFSSEEPYQRYFGWEILSHKPNHVDLGFLKGGTAPFLVGHWTGDVVGVVETAKIDGAAKKGRAVVRFGKSARADEIFGDVVDGIRRNISVGYHIRHMILEEEDKESGPTYRVDDWKPLEISLVAIPADESVGVGKAAHREKGKYKTVIERMEKKPMAEKVEVKENTVPAAPPVDVEALTKNARKAEVNRINELIAIGEMAKMPTEAMQAVTEGKAVDVFRAEVLEVMAGRQELKPARQDAGDIGLSGHEVQQYSFVKAINALANPADRHVQQAAAFEREASEAVARQLGRSAQGFLVPAEVLRRDLSVTTDSAGGYLVATDLLAANFIEMLRNRMMVQALGAIMLGGLVGDVAIPKQSGGATAYWVTESGAPTESQQTIGQLGLTPKTVGAFTDLSRKLLKQSSIDVEAFVRRDLAAVLALAIDLAAINGSGTSNQPTGILNTTGIGAVVCGDPDGAAPVWADIVGLETEVAADNADVGSLAYLTNAKVRGKLKTTEKVSSTGQFIWPDMPVEQQILNGYRAAVSNQVPSDLTKGGGSALSAVLFGNWADLVVAMWGTLDLTVDPYSNSTSGTVRVVALQDADIGVRHAESFAAIEDAVTT